MTGAQRGSGGAAGKGAADALVPGLPPALAPAPTGTPPAEAPVGLDTVSPLISRQFPRYAHLPLSRLSEGWDNVVYRLGDDFSVRIPRHAKSAQISTSEIDWLPRLSKNWTFPVPAPVAVGQPDAQLGYPWRWSVVPWLPGTVAMEAPLSSRGAADLGAALAQVHVPAPYGAPTNEWRGVPLPERAGRLHERLGLLAKQAEWSVDLPAALAVFAAAEPRGDLTWCHLDVHGNNVLTLDGRLAGLLDWGDSGAGDPATDLGQALYMVGSADYEHLAAAYMAAGGPADPFTPRVRAEALNYAVTMATLEETHYRASGWRSLSDLGLASPAQKSNSAPASG